MTSCTLPPCGAPRTPPYHQDHVCMILDCPTCSERAGYPVPMAVLLRHDPAGTDAERAHMRRVLKEMFPSRTIDEQKRSIPGHDHMHARRVR